MRWTSITMLFVVAGRYSTKWEIPHSFIVYWYCVSKGLNRPVSFAVVLNRKQHWDSNKSEYTVTQMESASQTLEVGYLLKTRNMAISAAMVFPEPVGAPSRTLVSVWYSVWKIWVWMGLKWVNLYRLSYSRLPRAVTGNGCRSSSSERERVMKTMKLDYFHKTTFLAEKSGVHQKRITTVQYSVYFNNINWRCTSCTL